MTVTSAERPLLDAHALDADAVLAALVADAGGLTTAAAQERLASHGPNTIPEPPTDPAWKRFLSHFDDILIYILLAAAALKVALGEWVDFWVILGVAVINAVIGYVQEGRAEQALAGIRNMLTDDAQVLRDGEWGNLPAENLVPGDIVRVSAGSKVPADLRLLEASNLRVEEAALTGEAVPSSKAVDPVAAGAGIGDRASMLFSSSLVSAGQGIGVVTATGADAEIGRITSLLSAVDDLDTPLTRQIGRFGKQLSLVIAAMAVLMVVIGKALHGMPAGELISATIGFAVAAIPEGLPALVTITLALGVQQMARRNAIVRKLPAVETLGSITRICSDKTGTLTTNEMTVRTVVTRAGEYTVKGLGYNPSGSIGLRGADVDLAARGDLRSVVTAMSVVNDAVVAEVDGHWTLVGEPTEGALRTLGMKAGFDPSTYPRTAVLPFDSAHKYMATANTTPEGHHVVLVKGAPDRLLDRSELQLSASGAPEPLDRAWWDAQVDALSSQGLRVLAAASRPLATASAPDAIDHDDLTGLVLLGLCGIVDPPRPEAIRAIATCHEAGIKVTMITGDHAGTATAISREMGIFDESTEAAITGAELEAATDEQLRTIVERTETFARTSPEHKLRLVRAFQANGEVIAMTGDGVNDAPALKRADVGVAMGIKGTEATKEAADIVLADDNFATIEHAVEEGRRINDNLHKSVLFILPTNGAQSLVVLVAVLFGLTMPLESVQILWVNMVTSITLSLALAYEPAEPDIMRRPPRPPGTPLVSARYLPRLAIASVLIAAATLATFVIGRVMTGGDLEIARTWAVNTLVLGQVAYLFNSRFLRESSLRREAIGGNPVVWAVVGILVVLQAAFVYVPVLNSWFGSAAVGVFGWLIPLAFAVVIFVVMEAAKAAVRRAETR
ncbi:HAD-IC family P-type ATPase [Propionicimonas sp.]|uniref:HAD-IC family P-type ATPase n=1 Tax=Propionicimonas sp. TaxID=1955623 RepID=UPI0039E2885A